MGPSINDAVHFQWFLTRSLPLHTCSHLADPLPPVLALTKFENETEFFSKNLTLSPAPSPYKNTKKVSHKVKYLLATLIQDEERERINIYLKISYGSRKKIVFVLRNLYTALYDHINVSPADSNKCGIPSIEKFNKSN